MATDPIPAGGISFSAHDAQSESGSSHSGGLAPKQRLQDAALVALATPRPLRGAADAEGTPRYERLHEEAIERDRRLEERRRNALQRERRWLEAHSVHQADAGGSPGGGDRPPCWERLNVEAREKAKRLEEMRRRAIAGERELLRAPPKSARLGHKGQRAAEDGANAEPCWVKLQLLHQERERKLEEKRRQRELEELQWLKDVSIHKAASAAVASTAEGPRCERHPVWLKLNEYGARKEQRLEEMRRRKEEEERQWLDQHSVHRALPHVGRPAPRGESDAEASPPRWQQLHGMAAEKKQRLEERRRQLAEEEQRWLEENSIHRDLAH